MNILHPLRVWQLFLFLAVGDTLWAYFFKSFWDNSRGNRRQRSQRDKTCQQNTNHEKTMKKEKQ
jgi:hypothetical protein